MLGPLLDVQLSFCRRKGWCTLSKVSKAWGYCSSFKTFCVAGAVQETMLGGQRADFLIGVAFWSMRSSGLPRWFRVTGAPLRMTWPPCFVPAAALETDGEEKSQDAMVRGRQLSTRLSIFGGSLAELLRFWCCQLWKLRKSRKLVSFLMLSSSKIEDVRIASFSILQIDR